MGNPYPVEITDEQGEARLTGLADFTDSGNQPGGGSLAVSDGETTVSPATSIVFTGATVTDGGDGEADVSIAGGGGGPLFAELELVLPDSPNFGGSTQIACVPANSDQTWALGTLMLGPITLAAGKKASFRIFPPTYGQGTLTIGVMEFQVANAAGTQKCLLQMYPDPEIALPSDTGSDAYAPLLTTFDVGEQIGADLSVIGDTDPQDNWIRSTAGGQFFIYALVGMTATGVAT